NNKMKNKTIYQTLILSIVGMFLVTGCSLADPSLSVTSKDGLNTITLSLNEQGELSYTVSRKDQILLANSPLGLVCDDQDFTIGLSVADVSPVEEKRETYELKVSNFKSIDHVLETRSVTVKNEQGARMAIDLVASNEGVAFRYRFPDQDAQTRTITNEITGFQIDKNAKGWLQPYNKAGKYTPAYEDFYLPVTSGSPLSGPRNPSVGWCMPALFHVNESWVLIAESATDGSYPGCHL